MCVTVIAFQFYSESPRKSRGFLARLIALKDYCSHDGTKVQFKWGVIGRQQSPKKAAVLLARFHTTVVNYSVYSELLVT